MTIEMSTEVAELFKALHAFQAECAAPKKKGWNGHFKTKYADLGDVLDAIQPFMAKHGLSHVQMPCDAEKGSVGVCTQLNHVSGQWLRAKYSLPLPKNDPQGVGTCISYGRRYGLLAALGLAAEDDDAQYASTPPKQGRDLDAIAAEGEPRKLAQTPKGAETSARGGAPVPLETSSHTPHGDLDAAAWRARYEAECERAMEMNVIFSEQDEFGMPLPPFDVPRFSPKAKKHAGLQYTDVPAGFIREVIVSSDKFDEQPLGTRLHALHIVAHHELTKEKYANG